MSKKNSGDQTKEHISVVKFFRNIIQKVKMEIRYRKRLKELRKRDPFIYK